MRGIGMAKRKAGLAFKGVGSVRSFSGTAATRADFGHVVRYFPVSESSISTQTATPAWKVPFIHLSLNLMHREIFSETFLKMGSFHR